jgi:hypothetical protein
VRIQQSLMHQLPSDSYTRLRSARRLPSKEIKLYDKSIVVRDCNYLAAYHGAARKEMQENIDPGASDVSRKAASMRTRVIKSLTLPS